MRFSSLVRRRPPASLVVSFAALFVALGGVGYAATQLPANSVGSTQLRNGSVGNWKLRFNSVGSRKIINGSVGAKQVNSSQVQLRVSTGCNPGSAIQSIGLSGSVSCTATAPNEFGLSAPAVTLGGPGAPGETGTLVADKPLGGGTTPYLILAYPHAVISGTAGTAQRVEVDCTLSVPTNGEPGTASTSSSLAVDLEPDSHSQAGSIPLALAATPGGGAASASVSCSDTATPSTPAPTVSVDATINAIETASNN